jgi:hypothetical protein
MADSRTSGTGAISQIWQLNISLDTAAFKIQSFNNYAFMPAIIQVVSIILEPTTCKPLQHSLKPLEYLLHPQIDSPSANPSSTVEGKKHMESTTLPCFVGCYSTYSDYCARAQSMQMHPEFRHLHFMILQTKYHD